MKDRLRPLYYVVTEYRDKDLRRLGDAFNLEELGTKIQGLVNNGEVAPGEVLVMLVLNVYVNPDGTIEFDAESESLEESAREG